MAYLPRAAVATVSGLMAVLLLASCGGSDDTTADNPKSAPTAAPSSTAPETPPEYVESETCRTSMTPLLDIMLANEPDSLSYNEFTNRFDQLDKQVDRAVAACSPAVNDPTREAMYQFALANAKWRVCNDNQCAEELGDIIGKGVNKAKEAKVALEKQT